MKFSRRASQCFAAVTLVLGNTAVVHAQVVDLHPSTLKRVGTVSPRFQSYNVEMIEVTGGRFWAPYK